MPVTIKRTCQFCREPFENGIPTCECCPECGGTPNSYACDDCLDVRAAAKEAASTVWQNHLRETVNA